MTVVMGYFLFPLQIIFEAVTSGQRGLLAIKDVVIQGHQCSKSSITSSNIFHCYTSILRRPEKNQCSLFSIDIHKYRKQLFHL